MTEEYWAQWKKKKDASGQNPMLLGVSTNRLIRHNDSIYCPNNCYD